METYLLFIKNYDDPRQILDIVCLNSLENLIRARQILEDCDAKVCNGELYNGFFNALKENKIPYSRVSNWVEYKY